MVPLMLLEPCPTRGGLAGLAADDVCPCQVQAGGFKCLAWQAVPDSVDAGHYEVFEAGRALPVGIVHGLQFMPRDTRHGDFRGHAGT